MKKGSAMEGFIRGDGTIRPIEHYDDTELRGKIQTNTDNISNLNSRVTELEEHGGAEDQTKADKVSGAIAGHLASLDENGNLQDSGKKPSDFAPVVHDHLNISYQDSDGSGRVYTTSSEDDGGEVHIIVKKGDGDYKSAIINDANINNLTRALATPSSTPENDATKLITSQAVYDALAGKAGIYNGTIRVDSAGNNSYPIPEGGVVQAALDSFVESSEQDKMYNVLAQFVIVAAGFAHYCPAIVYWSIDSEDSTIIMHIHAGDYRFVATKQEGATAWKQEKFDKSSFLETF
jgi:hypothetical protein